MNPKSTAIIMVGYQNDYFAANGILRGVVEEPDRVDSVLVNTLDFIRAVVSTPITIISTPIVLEPGYRALANSVGILDTIKASGACRLITVIFFRPNFSAFSRTSLQASASPSIA